MDATEVMKALHAALAKHSASDPVVTHRVELSLSNSASQPWCATATFGDPTTHEGRYYKEFRAYGRAPDEALAGLVEEVRKPDLRELETQRRNLALLDALPRL